MGHSDSRTTGFLLSRQCVALVAFHSHKSGDLNNCHGLGARQRTPSMQRYAHSGVTLPIVAVSGLKVGSDTGREECNVRHRIDRVESPQVDLCECADPSCPSRDHRRRPNRLGRCGRSRSSPRSCGSRRLCTSKLATTAPHKKRHCSRIPHRNSTSSIRWPRYATSRHRAHVAGWILDGPLLGWRHQVGASASPTLARCKYCLCCAN